MIDKRGIFFWPVADDSAGPTYPSAPHTSWRVCLIPSGGEDEIGTPRVRRPPLFWAV